MVKNDASSSERKSQEMAPFKTKVQKQVICEDNPKEDKKKESQKVNAQDTMRTVDYVWKAFIYLTFILAGSWYFLTYFAYQQQQDYKRFDHKRFGLENQEQLKQAFAIYNWPKVSQLWICVASAFVHEICSRATAPMLTIYFDSISTVLGNNELKKSKVEKAVMNTYKGIYFTFSSFFAWYLMSQGNFLPWFMGGSSNNSLKNIYNNYPMVQRINGLKELVLITGGYHVWSAYKHQISKVKRNDFLEMCLHDLITITLFAGGHVMGDYCSGLVVIFITDFTDVWVHFAKATCDTHWKKACDFFGFKMWFWWAYCRIFCFPVCIYYMLLKDPFDIPNMQGSYEGYLYFFKGSLCSMLAIMNVWWFILISKMVFNAIFKGKQEDTQNKID